MVSRVGCSGVAAVLVVVVGCASPPKMTAKAPIEKRSVSLGTAYEQNGQAIDRADMIDKLEAEPRAAEELSGYSAFSVTSLITATAGGALVGWPVGQAIAGEEDPLWLLAGIGAGLIAVSIPFAIVAENKVANAVDAHNERLGTASAPLGSSGVRTSLHVQTCSAERGASESRWSPAFHDSLRVASELSVKSLDRGGSARRSAQWPRR